MADSPGFAITFKRTICAMPDNLVDAAQEQNRPDPPILMATLVLCVNDMAGCDILHPHWLTAKKFRKAQDELKGYIEEAHAVLARLSSTQDAREPGISGLAALCRLLDYMVCCDVLDPDWTTDKLFETAQKQLGRKIEEAYAVLDQLAPTRDLRELYTNAMKKMTEKGREKKPTPRDGR